MNKKAILFILTLSLSGLSAGVMRGQEGTSIPLLAVNVGGVQAAVPKTTSEEPVRNPDADSARNINSFKTLFAKSPFVMASAGEQSPISQRYVITGVVKIGEEARVFLLDQTTKNRLMISAEKSDGNVSLVSLQANSDPSKVRVTLRVGGDTGVVGYAREQVSPNRTAQPEKPSIAAAQTPPAMLVLTEPEATAAPASAETLPPAPKRVIIRRAPIPRGTAPTQEAASTP